MKCYVDEALVRQTDIPHPDCTKGGGALDYTQYDAFAAWLIEGIDNYDASGISLYALSPQNEPYFWQSFNSCFYAQAWYAEMLNGVMPTVKAAYPNVKIFGAENMLSMEAGSDWPWFYHGVLMDDPTASDHLDILAVHGYSDGVAPDSGSTLAGLWQTHLQEFSEPMGKPNWMTETSGYVDEWENGTNSDGDQRPGALSLAMDIHAALFYGNLQGWVWWQGSELGSRIGEYVLMNGTEVGEKYTASKHFYRFIRPGAVRLETVSRDDEVFLTAYEHSANGTLTAVVINAGDGEKTVTIGVSDTTVPGDQFEVFMSSETSNCERQGTIAATDTFSLPARSVVTLQAGGTVL
jgi:O-glycosyl hydrolase